MEKKKRFLGIRKAMLVAGISQIRLADKIGMNQQSLSNKLTGITPFMYYELLAIRDALGVSVDDLLEGEKPRPARRFKRGVKNG